jgi:2-polyprenyl-6-methoxyphenol hydroxylase-like FAD-dependent oxidoreductase
MAQMGDQQQQVEEIDIEAQMKREQVREAKKVTESFQTLNEMSKDINVQVHKEGEKIADIETAVEETKVAMVSASSQLAAAVEEKNARANMHSVAIIGAGPAGLITALSLARREGFEIVIYEREEDHKTAPRYNPDRSYTIDITGHGLKALQYCEATERFDQDLIKFKGMKLRAPLNTTEEWNEPGWTGSRGDICRALQSEIDAKAGQNPSAVVWEFDTDVKILDVFDGKLELTKEGSKTEKSFDLVVGCDGAGAVSRRAFEEQGLCAVESFQAENYASMIHFDTPEADNLDPCYLEIFSFDPFVVAGAINGEGGPTTAKWFCMIGFNKDTKFDSVADAKSYIEKLAGKDFWKYASDKEMEEFIKRPCNNIGRAKMCSTFNMGKCVMVGDSGNPFPPIGQGINHAMEAAMVLDQCIGEAIKEGKRLEFATAKYTETWKDNADGINWLARRCDFGNPWKMLLVKAAIAGGFSALQEAKKSGKSYKECADEARNRQKRLCLNPDSESRMCGCSIS